MHNTTHERHHGSESISWLSAIHRSLVGWAFQRLYHEFAWLYDLIAWLVSRGLWYQWTRAALPYLRGQVLELGCGTGYMQHALAIAHPHLVVGIDASPQMLAQTIQRSRYTAARVWVLRAVAQALPFSASSFDTVLATFPTSYILHPDTLAEIRRILPLAGRLVLVDAAHFTAPGVYERLVDLAYRLTFWRGATAPTVPARHPYQDFLEQAGFVVEVYPEQVRDSRVLIFVASPHPPDAR